MTEKQKLLCSLLNCLFFLVPAPAGAGGPIASPGYSMGEDYPNNQNITWTFRSEPGSIFVVNVTDLDVEYAFDFLVIGYGNMPSQGTTIARLTGTLEDLTETVFETPENELWLRLMSDDSFNGRGFYLNIVVEEGKIIFYYDNMMWYLFVILYYHILSQEPSALKDLSGFYH